MALFRCLHTFHHSKADKYKVAMRGSHTALGHTGTDQPASITIKYN